MGEIVQGFCRMNEGQRCRVNGRERWGELVNA